MVLGYAIGEEIGEGAQASVRLGYKDGEYVAIKILQKVIQKQKSLSGHELLLAPYDVYQLLLWDR